MLPQPIQILKSKTCVLYEIPLSPHPLHVQSVNKCLLRLFIVSGPSSLARWPCLNLRPSAPGPCLPWYVFHPVAWMIFLSQNLDTPLFKITKWFLVPYWIQSNFLAWHTRSFNDLPLACFFSFIFLHSPITLYSSAFPNRLSIPKYVLFFSHPRMLLFCPLTWKSSILCPKTYLRCTFSKMPSWSLPDCELPVGTDCDLSSMALCAFSHQQVDTSSCPFNASRLFSLWHGKNYMLLKETKYLITEIILHRILNQ